MENLTPEDFFTGQPLASVHLAVAGRPVKLRCRTRHPSKVVWYLNNRPLLPTDKIFIHEGEVGITSVNPNNTGNYSCFLPVTKKGVTTLKPQSIVFVKLSTSKAQIDFNMALHELFALFIVLLVVQVPLSCVTPVNKWYKVEARRYTVMINTMYRIKQALDNMRHTTREYIEARKIQRLRAIMEAIKSRNICHMVELKGKLARRKTTAMDEDEWFNLLCSETWRLQNTTQSQAYV